MKDPAMNSSVSGLAITSNTGTDIGSVREPMATSAAQTTSNGTTIASLSISSSEKTR